MNEYLPSITVQKGFFTNNFYNRKRFFSIGNNKKNLYQNSPRNNINSNQNDIVNDNNFLIVSNIRKDEINSNKNTMAITYYNRGFSDKKIHSNKYNKIPETIYKYLNNDTKNIRLVDNFLLKSYNNNKIIKENINKIIKNGGLRNYHLFLPEVQTENKIKGNSQSVSNKENNLNNINISNSLLNIKKVKNIDKNLNNTISKRNIISHEKIDCRNNNIQLLKGKETLTAIGFLDNKKNKYTLYKDKSSLSVRKTVSSDIKYDKNKENDKKKNLTVLYSNIKSIKSFSNINNINLDINNNLNNNLIQNNYKKISQNSNTKICPLCHKEKENYRFAYHMSLHPSKILDWLYLGSYRNACDKREIKDLGINYVLNCATECRESFPPEVKYCHLKLNDSPNFRILSYLDRATNFINQAQSNNGIILVHCQLGISRSTTCVIAYFIKYLGYTAMSALNFIKRKRTQVMPNYGFLNQLLVYEKNNLNIEKK